MTKVGIIGGGISGLTYAYFLGILKPDWKITIFEKSERPGGFIHSNLINDGNGAKTALEKGPRTLRGVSEGTLVILDLLERFGQDQLVRVLHKDSPANKKYLLSPKNGGSLLQVPSDWSTTVKFLRDPIGRSIPLSVFKELFVTKGAAGDESVESFVTRHFGKALSDNVVSAMMNGIYAADVATLSVQACLPKLVAQEKKNVSIERGMIKNLLWRDPRDEPVKGLSLPMKKYIEQFKPTLDLQNLQHFLKPFPMALLSAGLESLPKTIAKNLPGNVKTVYNADLTSLEPTDEGKVKVVCNGSSETFDHVRSTINVGSLKKFFKCSDELKQILESMKYSTLRLANVYVPDKNLMPVPGFGFLVPKVSCDDKRLLGVIFDSDVEHNAKTLFTDDVKEALKAEFPGSVSWDSTAIPDYESLQKSVADSASPLQSSQLENTKVTFMLGGWMYEGLPAVPTEDEIKGIVHEVFSKTLGTTLPENALIEVSTVERSIPVYSVGYEEKKERAWKLAADEFKGAFTFGGMTFGDGAGVPDCVMRSLTSAMELVESSE